MAVVETMRGPVDLGNLGQTLMHEHVFVLSTEHVQNYGSDWWDEEAMVARAIDKLNAVYAKGVHRHRTHRPGHRPDPRRDRHAHHRAHLRPAPDRPDRAADLP